jgi:hypothetical protein
MVQLLADKQPAALNSSTKVPNRFMPQCGQIGLANCMTLNPQSTLNNAGLLARPPHSLYPRYTPVPDRCWHVGTTLVHRTLVDATVHRLIDRWGAQTGRWLSRCYYLRIKPPMIVPMPTRAAPSKSCLISWAPLGIRVFHGF